MVRDGHLANLDLGEMEAELMARARAEAPIPPEQPRRDRRRREAVRRYYAERRHLAEPPGQNRA